MNLLAPMTARKSTVSILSTSKIQSGTLRNKSRATIIENSFEEKKKFILQLFKSFLLSV